ncbi:copper resistance CopC family protein [Cellulomonas sp.]|uniref:copper resistance CopC family protein n=1 Tax=Cellulomonas sp. TaxID=40001 RepID=UPI003BA8C451
MPSLRPVRTATLAGILGLALALSAVVLGASAAQAHTVLQSTDPAVGSTVPVVPEIITLTFSEPVLALGTTIMVHTPDETMVNIGPPVLVDNTVSQAVTGELPAGEYTVLYRVTAADGHPVEDQFRFTAAGATSYGVATPAPTMTASPTSTPTPSPSTSAEVTPTPSASPTSPPATELAGRVTGPVLVGVVAALVAAGGVVALLLVRRRPAPPATGGSEGSTP